MKKNTPNKLWCGILPILAALIVCALTCLLSGQRLVFGCLWWECADSGYFDSQEIQIPRDYFPSDAAYSNLFTDSKSNGARQKEVQTVYWGLDNHSTALLHVYRYFGTSGAKRGYDTQIRILTKLFGTPLKQSGDLNYQSASADQLFVGCSGIRCMFVARYEEDLISLNMDVDRLMTVEDFKHIITYLDMVAAKRLGH